MKEYYRQESSLKLIGQLHLHSVKNLLSADCTKSANFSASTNNLNWGFCCACLSFFGFIVCFGFFLFFAQHLVKNTFSGILCSHTPCHVFSFVSWQQEVSRRKTKNSLTFGPTTACNDNFFALSTFPKTAAQKKPASWTCTLGAQKVLSPSFRAGEALPPSHIISNLKALELFFITG